MRRFAFLFLSLSALLSCTQGCKVFNSRSKSLSPESTVLHPHINQSEDGIQTGDLLFVGTRSQEVGGMSGAIADATGGEGVSYVHTAILEVDEAGDVWVIDATPERGVDRHPLDTLIKDFALPDGSHPHYEVMRLPDNRNAAGYIRNASAFIGEDYDLWFLPDNGRHYCTELVEDSYKDHDMPVFEGKPMNFRNKDGEFPRYWVELFAELGQEIPQGVKGTNPQDMHDDPRLQRVKTSRFPLE